jgi:general secretion pathway protein A
MPAFQTQRLAFERLLKLWDADLDTWTDATIPCNFAPSAGLQCLSRTGSWSDIRQLNLPVVLELWDRGSAPFYAAVTSLSADGFVMELGGQSYSVSAADLQDAWFGSYVVLWRMPPGYAGTLKRGDRHPSVRWLRDQLTSLGVDTPRGEEPALFDAALQDAVMAFQRNERLLADGIVGPATWIRIGQQLAQPTPKLDG